MESNEDNPNIENNKNDKYVHYQKINIFGEPYVGKTSLISLMENYDSNIFQLDFNSSEESFYTSSGMVEQVKQIEINLNEDRNLYFNVYKTNIDRFDSIKMNLDTLLVQTECIIIMWDNSSPKTFENIPPLISTIEDSLKQNEFKVPIFVLQNKMDLKFDLDEISVAKEKFDESIKKLKDDIFKVKYYHPLNQSINKKGSKIINCLLLGNQGSGKTSFIKSLLGEIITNLLSTIGLEKTPFNFSVEGKDCTFIIQDTAGQERYGSLAKSYYRNVDAFLLFFDVTNKESFDTVQRWIKSIVESKGNINDQYELFLVANKIDETDIRKIGKNKIDETDIRKIGKTQGKELATKYNIKYFEISCLKKINLYELLYEITLMSYKKCKIIEQKNKINEENDTNKRSKSIKLKKDNNKKIKKDQCCKK